MQVKLVRYIRLLTSNLQNNSSYDTLLSQTLYKRNYDGIAPRSRDRDYNREYVIDLEPIFEKEREEARMMARYCADHEDKSGKNKDTEKLMNISLSPSSYGRTFMMHYAIQVQLKHQSFFSKSTSLEIDINLDSSDKDFVIHPLYKQKHGGGNNNLRRQISTRSQ